ncbi:histidine phosphatase family protein [Alloscardovia criceti]|uniref:histidine phosphatase family protein n=1 Tax=Alloscardovia criceti TaxID=356828 RepID=UPI00038251F1|nr:histidine phosphatase family protein [Alloscardovia criceti]
MENVENTADNVWKVDNATPQAQYTTVHLVRHGEVHNPERVIYERIPGFHLSERGERMAHVTGQYLARQDWAKNTPVIFSSPLDRTIDTVTAIVKELGLLGKHTKLSDIVTTDARIIEASNEFRGKRVGYGEGALWKNGNWKLLTNIWRPSWGESYQELADRVQDFVFEKVDEFPGQHVIAVSHESPIWSFRHRLETGHAEHLMTLRHTALASVTSFTIEVGTHKLVSIEYADPAADVR